MNRFPQVTSSHSNHYVKLTGPYHGEGFQLYVTSKMLVDGWYVSCEISLRWMSLDLMDDKSTLVQVMAWCCQATTNYLSQCDPHLCCHMVSSGHNVLTHWGLVMLYVSVNWTGVIVAPSNGLLSVWCQIINSLRGRVTHICISILSIIGSDNGLSPGRRQTIIWTSAGILLIWPLGTNFSETLIKIHTFSFKKMHLERLSAKWRPFCIGLNVLNDDLLSMDH